MATLGERTRASNVMAKHNDLSSDNLPDPGLSYPRGRVLLLLVLPAKSPHLADKCRVLGDDMALSTRSRIAGTLASPQPQVAPFLMDSQRFRGVSMA